MLRRFWSVLLIPLSILLTELAHRNPAATERVFSRGVYVVLMESYGRVFGWIPFSVVQLLLFILPLAVLAYIVFIVICLIKNPDAQKRIAVYMAANTILIVSVIWFMFTILCGLNYARESFGTTAGFDVRPYPRDELIPLCEELVRRVNESSALVSRDAQGRMMLSAGNKYILAQDVTQSLCNLAAEYPVLGGFYTRPKPALYSHWMSYMDIVGIYVPFTMEAMVNVDVLDYNIPFSMAHELAHFKGYMREDEANFIAFLACRESGDPDMMYSGYMGALIYASNQLWTADPATYFHIMENLAEGVWEDFRANSAYWKQFKGSIADISSSINDSYLKSNQQTDGIHSYGRMVDLLLADYRKRLNKG